MEDEVRIGDGCLFASSGDVVVMAWRDPATLARGEWMISCLGRHLARIEGDVVVLLVILPSASPPDAKTRAYAATAFDAQQARIRRLMAMPLGDDLFRILVRMVMRSMVMWGWQKKFAVANDVDGAAREIAAARSAKTPTPEATRALLERVLETLAAPQRERVSA